jgi:hypothetical protein
VTRVRARTRARGEALVAFVALWAVTALAAALVAAVPRLPARVSELLALDLRLRRGSLSAGLEIWTTNLRALVLIGCAALVARRPALRSITDGLLAAAVGANAALVGAALGAYGPSLSPWLAHVPLEWAGLAIALGAYARARHLRMDGRELARRLGLAALVLAAAAALETWATPLRWP